MSKITAVYDIETAENLEKAATILAGEQSNGTFVELPKNLQKKSKRRR